MEYPAASPAESPDRIENRIHTYRVINTAASPMAIIERFNACCPI